MKDGPRWLETIGCLLVLSISVPNAVLSAEIFSYIYRDKTVAITILGHIDEDDDEQFRRVAIKAIKSGKLVESVHIYSPGGKTQVGEKIGGYVRLLRASTLAPTREEDGSFSCAVDSRLSALNEHAGGRIGKIWDQRCSCESACSLIWAGGVGRYGHQVGVHNPYFSAQSLHDSDLEFGSYGEAFVEKVYKPIERSVRAYLTRMDVPRNIADAVFAAGMNDMHYLTESELAQMRNFPAGLSKQVLSTCGPRPDRSDSSAASWFSCRNKLVDVNLTKGAKAFLSEAE